MLSWEAARRFSKQESQTTEIWTTLSILVCRRKPSAKRMAGTQTFFMIDERPRSLIPWRYSKCVPTQGERAVEGCSTSLPIGGGLAPLSQKRRGEERRGEKKREREERGNREEKRSETAAPERAPCTKRWRTLSLKVATVAAVSPVSCLRTPDVGSPRRRDGAHNHITSKVDRSVPCTWSAVLGERRFHSAASHPAPPTCPPEACTTRPGRCVVQYPPWR